MSSTPTSTREVIQAVLESRKARTSTRDVIKAVRASRGMPEPYVAGGPGGIPGAKDGLPPAQPDPWSFGAPVFNAEPTQTPEVARQILGFKQQVKAQGGDIDGKSDAEVLDLMRKFGPTPGATASDYQPPKTAADEFGRGLRRGVAYGLPVGLPGVEAMRESEQVQRAPEGFAGFAGQTLGGFAGLLDPGKAPENYGAIAFTGGVGRLLAAPLDVIGKNVAESLGKEAGARAVNMIREAVENAGQGGGMAALNELGNIPIDDWKNKPGESTIRVLKAAGVGAAAGLGLGGVFGAARGEVHAPRETLPERVFDGMLTADDAQVKQEQLRAAAEGQQAMADVQDIYANAPRSGELDPQIISAARQADQVAMDQARSAVGAIGADDARIVEAMRQADRVGMDQARASADAVRASEQTPAPVREVKAPAVDSLSYADLRARAKELGVLDGGPKTKAALVERVRQAEIAPFPEAGRFPLQTKTPTRESLPPDESTARPGDTEPSRQPQAFPAPERQATQESVSSPNPTRQPWEMTQLEAIGPYREPVTAEDIRRAEKSATASRKKFNKNTNGPMVPPPIRAEIGGKIASKEASVEEMRSAYRAYAQQYREKAEAHYESVKQALSEGRPVPPEVLADYPDLAANAKPPTPAEAGTTPTGTAAGQAEAPKASGENTKFYPLGENPNETTNRYAIKRDERRQRAPSGWVLVDRNGSDKLVGVFDLPESVLEIAADTPDQMTSTGYTMKENKILALLKKKPEELSIILNRVRQARRSTSKTPLWSDGDGEIRQGEAVYRNMGRSSWDALNEAARSAKARIDRQRSATLGRVDTPKSVRGKDIYVYARSNAGQMKPVAGPFYTQHEAESAAMAARSRIDKDFSRESVIRELSGFSYGAVDRGTKVDVLYPDLRSPEGSSPFTDYPGTAQDTAPPEGSQETIAKAAPESHHQTQPAPQNETPTTRQSPPETDAKADRTTTQEVSPRESAPSDRATDPGYSRAYPSSPDFTARRVIDKPEPGEPQGPVTAAMNSMTSEMREALNLKAYDSPERRTFQATMDNAVAKKIPERALDIASSVVAKPRGLSAEEEAGMTYRLMELDNQRRTLKDRMSKAKDDAEAMTIDAEHDRAVAEIDTITTALNKGGSDIARALNIRKMLLADDFSIVGIRNRLKKYELRGGKKATPEQMREFEALADRFEELTKRVEKAAQDSIDASAESTIKRHAATKRSMPKEAREKIIVDLAENVRQLIESGCR